MNQETPFASKRAPVAGLALMQQLVSDKVDLQKRLDAALSELDALKKQDHVGIVVNDFEVGLCADVPLGAKVYLAAGAQPAIAVTKEQVRSAGGIVHSNGNVFFTNLEQLNALLNAGAQPTPMTPEEAEALAHRRCSRYIFIDTKAPYQFGPKDLLDFVRDIEKGTRV